jgi:hypothetical protein
MGRTRHPQQGACRGERLGAAVLWTRPLRKILICGLLALFLVGCGPTQVGPPAGPQAWIDTPLDGSSLPLAPVRVVAHGADASGVSQLELVVNGLSQGRQAPQEADQALGLTTWTWEPPDPGLYLLEVRAQGQDGNWSEPARSQVTVLGRTRSTSTLTLTPTTTATSTATLEPSPVSEAQIEIVRVSEETIYVGGSSCGPKEVTIVAEAQHPAGIRVVVLFYRLRNEATGQESEFDSKAMDPIGDDHYQAPLDTDSLLGGAAPADVTFELSYQAVIQAVDGDTSVRTPLSTEVDIKPCAGG